MRPSSPPSNHNPIIDFWVGPLVRSLLDGESADLLEPLAFHYSPPAQDFENAALPVRPEPPDTDARAELARSLLATNQAMGHPGAQELSNALADPATEVVVTGQQAGLFGGPIYAVSKAIAATLWARKLTEAGRPAVAVFWIASEDHDFEEVRSASLGSSTFQACSDERSTRPVGQRLIDEPLIATIEEGLQRCLATQPNPPGLAQALTLARACYVEGEPFSHGFARLLPALLGDACPLLLDSQDPVLKKLQVAPVGRLLARAQDAVRALEAREEQIETAGFRLQIPSARSAQGGGYALPLFLHRGGCRCRVVLDELDRDSSKSENTTYSLRGRDESGTLEELMALISENPREMSPSALLRPVLQDAALGSTLQILGPGEIAYIPQAAPLYRLLEVPPPTVALRPQSVFVPARLHQHYCQMLEDADQGEGGLEESSPKNRSAKQRLPKPRAPEESVQTKEGLTAEVVLGPWPALESLLARMGDNGTLQEIDALESSLAEGLQRIEGTVETLSPDLVKALGKTGQHIERGLKNFRARVEKAGAQQAGVLRTRIDRLREIVLPDGKLQERTFCSLWMHMQFGEDFATEIIAQMSLDPRRLQVLPMNHKPVSREEA